MHTKTLFIGIAFILSIILFWLIWLIYIQNTYKLVWFYWSSKLSETKLYLPVDGLKELKLYVSKNQFDYANIKNENNNLLTTFSQGFSKEPYFKQPILLKINHKIIDYTAEKLANDHYDEYLKKITQLFWKPLLKNKIGTSEMYGWVDTNAALILEKSEYTEYDSNIKIWSPYRWTGLFNVRLSFQDIRIEETVSDWYQEPEICSLFLCKNILIPTIFYWYWLFRDWRWLVE